VLYCIEIDRECELKYITHQEFVYEPTRQDVLDFIMKMDLNYNDDYGKFRYYPVTREINYKE